MNAMGANDEGTREEHTLTDSVIHSQIPSRAKCWLKIQLS